VSWWSRLRTQTTRSAVGAIFSLFALSALGQISPGPLTRAHADLEGAAKCATCHNFGLGNRGLKCLECHGEIKRRIDERIGYHSRAYNPSAAQTDCARCHQEHAGRQFVITKFDKNKFEHKGLTGFALEGKHAQLKCEECHAPAKIPAAAKPEIRMRDLRHTYLGLTKECTACHKDEHKGQFGNECLRCHSQDAWKPANGFDHDRTQFRLTGLHVNVTCDKCHGPKPGETTAHYKGLAFAGCQDCHADPHKGAFVNAKVNGVTATCQSCHTTGGWKSGLPSSGFDHSRTKFPLHGKHSELTCAQCHKNNNFSEPIKHEECRDCHEDIHHGQFSSRKDETGKAASDCSSCHNDLKWKPALYTREMHQTSAFKLEGKHFKLECEKCHSEDGKTQANKDTVYKLKKLICFDCHPDLHGNEFRGEPYANKCEQCHTQDVFKPSTFNLTRHNKTRFTLVNAHLAIACAECHKTLQVALAAAAKPDAARQYHFSDQSCTGCHMDPHKIKTESLASATNTLGLTCERCHNTRQWRELKTFDHSKTKFTLEGAHQSATCAGCHLPPLPVGVLARNAPKRTVEFATTPKQCFECHEDIHGGQFMAPGKEQDCSACHSISKWGSAEFDHSKTSYPLEGAHVQVRCAQCHNETKEIAGRVTRVYHGTPSTCSACHGSATLEPLKGRKN